MGLQNNGTTTTTIPSVTEDNNAVASNQYPFDGGNSDRSLKMEKLVSTITTTTPTTTSKLTPTPATPSNDEDCSRNSEGLGNVDEEMNTSATTTSHVAATAAISTPTSTQEEKEESKEEEPRSRQTNNNSIVLQAIENWDWGTFGIDEIEDQHTEDTMQEIQMQMTDIEEEQEENENENCGGEGGGREITVIEDQDNFLENNI